MPSRVSKALGKFRTSGAAHVFALFALISQVCAGVLIWLEAFEVINPQWIQTVEKATFVALSMGILFTGLIIFGLRQFIIYVTRLFLSWILIFASFGYVLLVTKRITASNLAPYVEPLAFSTLILFILATIIFYSGAFISRIYIKITEEHREHIDRMEDQMSQIARRIHSSETEQLTKLILNARRSLSKLTHELFIRTVDAPKAFYVALLLSLMFFAVAYFALSQGIMIFQNNIYAQLLLIITLFTLVIILTDVIRLEKTRQTLIKG